MYKARSSDVKTILSHYLNATERNETTVITHHGKHVAHHVPAPAAEKNQVQKALAGIAALREQTGRMSVAEILSARHPR